MHFLVEFDDTNSNYCPLCGTSYHDAVNLTTHMWENHADLMGPKKRGRPKKILTTVSLLSFGINLRKILFPIITL